MRLEISTHQAHELKTLLDEALRELSHEIAATDNPAYRSQLLARRGSLTGVAVAIAVALAYWVVNGLFEAMGGVNYLPAVMAAWSSDVLFGLVGGYLLLRTPT